MIVLIFLLLGLVFGSLPDAQYQFKWFIFALISAWILGRGAVAKRFGLAAGALFAYVLTSAAYVWIYRENRYLSVPPYDQMALRYFAADSVAKLMLVLTPFLLCNVSKKDYRLAGEVMAAMYCLLSSLFVVGQFIFTSDHCLGEHSCGGAMMNPSMNAGMIVCTLPFVWSQFYGRWRYIVSTLAIVAVLLSKSAVGAGLMAAFLVLWINSFWLGAAAGLTAMVGGYMVQGMELFNSSDRVLIWKHMMGNWVNNVWNIPFGMGYGTYYVFGSSLQVHDNLRATMWWPWMHNDWLQGIFELGIVGFLLMVATYATAVHRARKEKACLVSLVLYGIFMSMDYPLHLSISCFFGAWLTTACLLQSGSSENYGGLKC